MEYKNEIINNRPKFCGTWLNDGSQTEFTFINNTYAIYVNNPTRTLIEEGTFAYTDTAIIFNPSDSTDKTSRTQTYIINNGIYLTLQDVGKGFYGFYIKQVV